MFVPSIECGGHRCSEKEKYNSSASSSYVEDGERVQKYYQTVSGYGIVGNETLHLGSLEIQDQQFIEMKVYGTIWPDPGVELFDSVLGLAYTTTRMDNWDPNYLDSPFRQIVRHGLLDRNMFSLSLATNGGEGDLTFGGVNEDFLEEGTLTSHKMVPDNATDWQIKVSSARLQAPDGTVLEEETYNNKTVAWLHSAYPGIFLPHKQAIHILQHLQKDITYDKCTHLPTIPCDSRSLLPTLEFSFPNADGEGEQIIQLTGEDYVMQFIVQNESLCDGKKIDKCVVMVDMMPDAGDPGNQHGEFDDMIVLGQAMMGSLVGVFDWDEKMISFGKRKK
ncbi:aspartic peptidase domain-containing protein [Tricladium varicosporioides]|nr:aspartic peptidase domain-containing protein [Hymenoscyphus varicosporioides]